MCLYTFWPAGLLFLQKYCPLHSWVQFWVYQSFFWIVLMYCFYVGRVINTVNAKEFHVQTNKHFLVSGNVHDICNEFIVVGNLKFRCINKKTFVPKKFKNGLIFFTFRPFESCIKNFCSNAIHKLYNRQTCVIIRKRS